MATQKQFDKMYIEFAFKVAELSKAERLKVGAVLTLDNRPLANGYNGTISGQNNSCEEEILTIYFPEGNFKIHEKDLDQYADPVIVDRELVTKDTVLHAEANLITFCAKNGIKTNDGTVYVTHMPCSKCCTLLIQSGIKRIVYAKEYRQQDSLRICLENNVSLEKLND